MLELRYVHIAQIGLTFSAMPKEINPVGSVVGSYVGVGVNLHGRPNSRTFLDPRVDNILTKAKLCGCNGFA